MGYTKWTDFIGDDVYSGMEELYQWFGDVARVTITLYDLDGTPESPSTLYVKWIPAPKRGMRASEVIIDESEFLLLKEDSEGDHPKIYVED